MDVYEKIPQIIQENSLDSFQRIDVGLEGNWNPTVVILWTPDAGLIELSSVIKSHPIFKPSLELYFKDSWLGVHCFDRINSENVFNENLAKEIIKYIEIKSKL